MLVAMDSVVLLGESWGGYILITFWLDYSFYVSLVSSTFWRIVVVVDNLKRCYTHQPC